MNREKNVNGRFTIDEAIEHGRRLHELGVLWFEEPVRPMRDHDAIARVGSSIGCALAGGENEYLAADFERLMERTQVRFVQPELTKVGGLTPARQMGVTERE